MREGLDQIVSEYRRFRTEGRSPPETKFCLPDGNTIELCHTNGSDWTLCVLPPGDDALTPVRVGDDSQAGSIARTQHDVLRERAQLIH